VTERIGMDGSGRTSSSVPAILIAGLITVVCIHWLPLLGLFFSVPLLIVFFTNNKKTYSLAVLFAFFLDCALSFVFFAVQGFKTDSETFFLGLAQSSFIILPLLTLALPIKLQNRYRVALSGVIAALAWFFFFINTGLGNELTKLMSDVSTETSQMLSSMVSEGFDRTSFGFLIDPERLASFMLQVLSCSVVPLCIAVYALGYVIGSFFSRRGGSGMSLRFKASSFYNDYAMFIPLVFGMCGIIAVKFLDAKGLNPLFWNIFLTAGLFFLMQGYGIASFFMDRLRLRIGPFWSLLIFFGIFVFAVNFAAIFIGALLIVGVVELFVPLRARFNDKDIIDPTPGRDNDHKE
jgi:hypothetical protein